MSVNETTIEAPPEAVWDVLADPPSYEEWVVGNTGIRDHDHRWPAPGTEFHHKVGLGPLHVKDKTVALEATSPSDAAHAAAVGGTPPVPRGRLVMNVRVLPVGHGIVAFELSESGSGTLVRMEERPAGGPIKAIWPGLDPLVKLRNAETLRRLKNLAESRHQAGATRG
jgi:uncharacterized protein YndB with AHSA1/START domain